MMHADSAPLAPEDKQTATHKQNAALSLYAQPDITVMTHASS